MSRDAETPSPDDLPPGWGQVATGVPESAGAGERHAPEQVRPVDLRDYVRFDPQRPVRVRVLATGTLRSDLWCLEPRQSTVELRYPGTDVSYAVVGGTAWFTTDEGELGLGPLGAILVPAGVGHAIHNRTVDPTVVLASSPASPEDEEPLTDAPVADTSQAVRTSRDRGLLRRLSQALRPDETQEPDEAQQPDEEEETR